MEGIQDLYNFEHVETGADSADRVNDLIKAMSAGAQTGRDLTGQDTSGSALKTESLDPTLKILTSKDSHIVLWKMIPKQKAYNTVEEYLQLVDYGLDVGIFNTEGETPQFTDSIYRRQAALIKYTGVSGEVTHPFSLVNLGGGVSNALAQEVYNKTQFLIRSLDKSIPIADSAMVSNQFDGIFAQHYSAVATSLDNYFASSLVIDARGKALADSDVEDAAQAVVNDNFGSVADILAAPRVFNEYVKRFHESKRVMVNNPLGATTGATMGQKVNTIMTQFGDINVNNDIFFDYKQSKAYNAAATSTKAPAAPTAVSRTAVTDTLNKFGADFDGSYWYGVTAVNRYGESAMTLINTSALAIATTESADLVWTQTDTTYASESFKIYRTELGAAAYTTASFYPIFTVSKAQHTAGYDGGAAGTVRDRNRCIPNTNSALVFDNATDIWAIKQLAPIMRMDLARTSPSFRFMILAYLTPVLFQGKKFARIVNLGNDLT